MIAHFALFIVDLTESILRERLRGYWSIFIVKACVFCVIMSEFDPNIGTLSISSSASPARPPSLAGPGRTFQNIEHSRNPICFFSYIRGHELK